LTFLVSVTRLRLRSPLFLPGFALQAWRTQRQVRSSPGFLAGALLPDRRRTFWTMSVWESPEAMQAYVQGGAHRTAMPRLVAWCDEASVVHWSQDAAALPAWSEAERRMRETGRASKVRHPSAQQQALAFAPAQAGPAAEIRPRSNAA
jgi:hypothetical protein